MKIDPSRIPDMAVCRACRGIVGCFHRQEPHRGLRGRLVQRETCRVHKPSRTDCLVSRPGRFAEMHEYLTMRAGTTTDRSGPARFRDNLARAGGR